MRQFNSPLLTGPRAQAAADALPGLPRGRRYTRDEMLTYDAQTVDSTGSFLVGELERLDPTVNAPLVSYTWSRDIDLRTDVTIGDEVASFTNSSLAAPGGINPAGKNWISKEANSIPGIALDIGKTSNPIYLWGMELGWSIPELESSIRVGRPVDSQKLDGLQLKWQMDIDEQVYIGDSGFGVGGLFNLSAVTPSNAPNGAGGSPLWSLKTPAEILADVNALIQSVWTASGWTVVPSEIRIPPTQFAYINNQMIGALGQRSILSYLLENNMALTLNGRAPRILPQKWLVGRGAGATNRMVAYTKEARYVRMPLVPLARTPLEARSLWQLTTYYGRLGVVETPYPETLGYMDGI